MILIWFISCFFALAQQPDPTVVDPTLLITGPKEGNITLDVSRDTRVELFPRAKRMEIEFVLYGNCPYWRNSMLSGLSTSPMPSLAVVGTTRGSSLCTFPERMSLQNGKWRPTIIW